MATPNQIEYFTDLAVIKTKDFKEVKELLVSNRIVRADSAIVANAGTLGEIGNALTDNQASMLIDVLISAQTPVRSKVYGAGRVRKTIEALEDIKATIDDWGF